MNIDISWRGIVVVVLDTTALSVVEVYVNERVVGEYSHTLSLHISY